MPIVSKQKSNLKFPLRLMPSIRRTAEAVSEREGVSLNQFINLAVAEKLVHLEHEEWVQRRKKPTQQMLDEALKILEKTAHDPIEPGDELPEGYQPVRSKHRQA